MSEEAAPSEATASLEAQRQASLAKLRGRRREARQSIYESRQERERDRLSLVIRAYKTARGELATISETDTEDDEADVADELLPPVEEPAETESSPTEQPPTEQPQAEAAELARVTKTRRHLERHEQVGKEAMAKWRGVMKVRRARQDAPEGEGPEPVAMPTSERRQMFSDLLTVDFLEQTRHWISSSPDDVDLSSTPDDEVEQMLERALYRRKVLDQLQKMNETEIDSITTYLKAAARRATKSEG